MSDSDHDHQNQQQHEVNFADDNEILAAARREGQSTAHTTFTSTKIGDVTVVQQQQTEEDEKEKKNHADVEALEINTQDTFISVENIRLFYLADIPLDKLDNCTELEVRKNLIHDLIPLPEKLRKQLTKLDLFDNKIKHIAPYFSGKGHPLFQDPRWLEKYPGVDDLTYSSLKTLDLSYNQIKNIRGLESLGGTLEELYLVENRLKSIDETVLSTLKKLRLLELGGNQIRAITAKSLSELSQLEELWIGKNKIATLEPGCFYHCPKLRLLSLQANRLTEIQPGVFSQEHNPNIEQLHLSENGLKEIRNIGPLKKMKVMDFSFNPIPSLFVSPSSTSTVTTNNDNNNDDEKQQQPAAAATITTTPSTELTVENFPVLEEFWMTDAKISDWKEVSVFAGFAKTLTTIYLERTPLEDDRRYRDKLFQQLPFLTQIDSWPIVNRSNPEADRAIHRR